MKVHSPFLCHLSSVRKVSVILLYWFTNMVSQNIFDSTTPDARYKLTSPSYVNVCLFFAPLTIATSPILVKPSNKSN
jgi:hypothetical protein